MSYNNRNSLINNTLVLYVRMIVIMAVTLYTSRVVLKYLGQDNYGIYNLIGGIVVLFSFITNSMTTSTQRFLNYYIGLNKSEKVISVFSSAKLAHYIIVILFLLLSETIGLWFIETKLNIPLERMNAVRWVYQSSVVSSLFGIVVIPYRAAIIATERMGVFAYISIIEVVLKLIITLVLPWFKGDVLIIYALLYCAISVFSFYGHKVYCQLSFNFAKAKFCWDKGQFKELLSFSVWYLFGGLAMVGTKQGSNILINIFFSITLNAAVGIANQVRTAVYTFVSSFQTAFNPQLVKLYAAKELSNLVDLIFKTTKFSYYLLFLISLPIIIYCHEILTLWLSNVPPYSANFTRLVIISSFFEALSTPLWTTIGATGKVRIYQIVVSLIILLELPISYFALSLHFQPTIVFVINVIISFVAYIFRIFYVKKYTTLTLSNYFRQVIIPCVSITCFALFLSLIIAHNLCVKLPILMSVSIIVLSTLLIIWNLGLTAGEKGFVKQYLKSKIAHN